MNKADDYHRYPVNISQSGLSIYDPIVPSDPNLWVPTSALEALLNDRLVGVSLYGLPLRTRSKRVKEAICEALGYPTPASFKRSHPRFPGQLFDTYIQKSNNLQIWNEDIVPTRRYIIIRVSPDDIIRQVKVVTGDVLVDLDTTGTLTQKFQARLIPRGELAELVVQEDTGNVRSILKKPPYSTCFSSSPVDPPSTGTLLPIQEVFDRLRRLVDCTFADAGHDQERKRGADLHRLVCEALGYEDYRDAGSFPDIPNQLLEVKLQTSPTIDLGFVRPDSQDPLDVPAVATRQIRHCDVRYALFYAHTDSAQVQLTHFFLTTGESFFGRFPQFQGKVINRKLQIPLPASFWGGESECSPDELI